MKKTLTALSAAMLLAGSVYADKFEDNLNATLSGKIGMDIKVVEKNELSDWKGVYFAIIESKSNAQRFPLFASSDGKSVLGYSSLLITPSKDDEAKIATLLKEAQDFNEKAKEGALKDLFAKVDEKSIIKLGDAKKPSLIIVSDPECPYCRKELESIEERLKTNSLKLILAPVHGKSAFVKSELIYKETAKAKSDKEKIKILKKYFNKDVKLSPKDEKMDTPMTDSNKNTIFSGGLIRGVPFVYEEK